MGGLLKAYESLGTFLDKQVHFLLVCFLFLLKAVVNNILHCIISIDFGIRDVRSLVQKIYKIHPKARCLLEDLMYFLITCSCCGDHDDVEKKHYFM